MSDQPLSYNWTIDERSMWPPRRRPGPPFGPTSLEVMRSCPLRVCFEISPGYERRMGFAARVGTAFHRTLESLGEDPPETTSLPQVAEEARRRFLAELAVQEAEKAARPRERTLPHDEARVNRAIEALMVEAQRLARLRGASSEDTTYSSAHMEGPPMHHSTAGDARPQAEGGAFVETGAHVEVEVPVRTADNLMHGRIDLAEHLDEGTRLTDYKSAVRDDLPERYERQLQLYTLMWHDTRGEWPTEAQVVYPFTASTHQVRVDPETCERVGAESRALIERVRRTARADDLATPGDVCKVCEFRPWCQPFWRWQTGEPSWPVAVERASLGFEGEIAGIEAIGGYWRLHIRWRDSKMRVVAPLERFPQLQNASVGMRVRAMDMRLQGQPQLLQAVVTDLSELFLLTR